MIAAFLKAFDQFSDPRIRRLALVSLVAAVIVFALLWLMTWFLLANTALFSWGWLESVVDFLGWLAALIFTWFLFPGVASAFVCLILDKVVNAVEARHYPHLPPAAGGTLGETLVSALKFLFIVVALNMGLLVFLLIPPIFPFVFYGVNGYLLGREYFEMIALRRIKADQARALRKAHRGQLFVAGVFIALMLTVPVVNFLAPIVATAAMVHLFETWRRR